jgi:hypothetical protein
MTARLPDLQRRIDASQASRSRSACELQEDGLSLIVNRVRSGDLVLAGASGPSCRARNSAAAGLCTGPIRDRGLRPHLHAGNIVMCELGTAGFFAAEPPDGIDFPISPIKQTMRKTVDILPLTSKARQFCLIKPFGLSFFRGVRMR